MIQYILNAKYSDNNDYLIKPIKSIIPNKVHDINADKPKILSKKQKSKRRK